MSEGDVSQLNNGDINGLAVQQAWYKLKLTDNLSVKLDRQAVILDDHKLRYSQTVGTHLKYKSGKLSLNSNICYQLGKDINLSSYLLGFSGTYNVKKNFNLILGGEMFLWRLIL